MPTIKSFNHKQECYLNTILDGIIYHQMTNNGRKPAVIFISEPLYDLLCSGAGNKYKSKLADITVKVFYDDGFSYWFAEEHQKGREP